MADGDQGEEAAQAPFNTPAQLVAEIRAKAARPDRVFSVSLLCHPQTPHKITCMISVAPDYARALAVECQGEVYGFTMVIAAVDVPPAFQCTRRPQIPGNCSCLPTVG